MADRKISELDALTTPAAGDYLPIVDISEAAAADKNKRITMTELLRGAPDGTAAAPGFAFESDGDNGMFRSGTNALGFSTGGSQRLTINSSGSLGIGISSPVFSSGYGGIHLNRDYPEIHLTNSNTGATATDGFKIQQNSGQSVYFWNYENAILAFATNNTERARLDASGRLLVGATSASAAGILVVQGNTSGSANAADVSFQAGIARTSVGDSTRLASLTFRDGDENPYASITVRGDGTTGSGDYPGRLNFSITPNGSSSPTERMRISNNGAVSALSDSTASFNIRNSGSSATSAAFTYFKSATSITTGTACMFIRQDGDLENANNRYTGISDIKLKENIVDANSQWDDLKALQVRNFNFKAETNFGTHTQIGLIAQEVELVSPGLVGETRDTERVEVPVLDEDGNPVLDEDGNPQVTTEERETGEVTKRVNYSVLYMKAVKALQEAMERIETLEAKVTALESA